MSLPSKLFLFVAAWLGINSVVAAWVGPIGDTPIAAFSLMGLAVLWNKLEQSGPPTAPQG
jgi:hypothetical protein